MLKYFTTLKKDEIDSIAIGGFDGVHLAHQQLISRLTQKGALLIIHRGGLGLTPSIERDNYHDRASIMIEFAEIKEMQAEAFITFLESEFPNLKKIVVGYDFRFGKDRVGDVRLLQKYFSKKVEVVEEYFYDGVSVHSKKIKEYLSLAEIKKANRLLGRTYHIKGEIISGQGIGKERLYPTLNLKSGDYFLPKEGVYATYVKIKEQLYPSVSFLGKRLSTDNAFSIETHILDENFSESVERIELYFVDFIRENRKFETLRDLKKQITQDIETATTRLAQLPPLF
jgi:riboflavin kinase/FMN adenylyltransferase